MNFNGIIRVVLVLFSVIMMFWVYVNYVRHDATEQLETDIYRPMNLDPFIVKPFDDGNTMNRLQNLEAIQWPRTQYAAKPSGVRYANGTVQALPTVFEPVMSAGQRALLEQMLRLFSNLMFANGYGDRFMLYGGTLLGSFRHHDLIPWDDDLDVMVDETIRPQVQSILNHLKPDYLLVEQALRDKVYSKLVNTTDDVPFSRRSSEYSWGWPFLDIGYYRFNETIVCEIAVSYGREYCWLKESIFPLRFRPFGKHWYPTPFDVLNFLRETYGDDDQCVMSGYSHVLEGAGPSGRTRCKTLFNKYAFVQHHRSEASLHSLHNREHLSKLKVGRETLVIRNSDGTKRAIHTIDLPVFEQETFVSTHGLGNRLK